MLSANMTFFNVDVRKWFIHISKSNGPRIDSCGASQEISSIYLMSLVFSQYIVFFGKEFFIWKPNWFLWRRFLFMKYSYKLLFIMHSNNLDRNLLVVFNIFFISYFKLEISSFSGKTACPMSLFHLSILNASSNLWKVHMLHQGIAWGK